jgi:anti-sigma B factor antagonist
MSSTSPAASELTVRSLGASSQCTIAVAGRVTVDSSPPLRSVLLEKIDDGKSPVVVIDLSGVSYMDTSGVATLLEASMSAREHSVRLRVIGIRGEPRLLAEVTGLGQSLRAEGSEVQFS